MATTVTLKPNAIDISGSTSGTTTLQATAVAGTTTLTLPAATDTLVGKATTDTLTNKTLTSPTITGGALNGTVGATTPSTGAFTTLSATGNVTLGDASTDTLNVGNGGLIKDASGNLGLGVTPNTWNANNKVFQLSNNAALFSRSAATGLSQNLFYNSSDASAYIADGYATLYYQTSGQHQWYTGPSGTANATPILFTQAMTLDASGNLLVGTTSVISGGKISVKGATLYDGKIVIDNSSSTGGGIIELRQNNSYSGIFAVRGSVLGSTAKDLALSAGVGLGVYTYTNDGTAGPYVASGGTSWTSSSDERLKNITGEIQNGLAKVCALRAAEFTWKSDLTAQSQVGLIAQDVQAVLPQAVNKSVQNKDDPTEYLGVAYTDTIPLLVAAIKEQQALITQLQADVAALKGA